MDKVDLNKKKIFFKVKNVDKKSKLQILKPIARRLPKLNPNEIFAEVLLFDTKLFYR